VTGQSESNERKLPKQCIGSAKAKATTRVVARLTPHRSLFLGSASLFRHEFSHLILHYLVTGFIAVGLLNRTRRLRTALCPQ
jgi:hypothetical protein